MIMGTTAASFNLSFSNIVYHDTLARQSFIVTSLCIQSQRTNSGDMIKVEGCSKLLCLRFPFLPENVIVYTTRMLTLFYTTGKQLVNSWD